jgi:hypothetical protein
LDYHCYLERHPDKIVKQSKWTDFTEQFYGDDEYERVRTFNDAYKELRGDLETFDDFGNFDFTKLDSYKVEEIILKSKDQYNNPMGEVKIESYDKKK